MPPAFTNTVIVLYERVVEGLRFLHRGAQIRA